MFRLSELISPDRKVKVQGMVSESIESFLLRIQDEPLALTQIGLDITKEQALDLIKNVFVT